jgi:hypothetical protein
LGRHLFDLPHGYNETVEINDVVLVAENGCWFTKRDLSQDEREQATDLIRTLNREFEKANGGFIGH